VRFYQKPRFWFILGVVAVALLIVQQFWHWEVERVEVPPGKFLVRVHKWGKDLPPDQIIAPDDSYMGVVLEPLPEGRHFINPVFWTYEIRDMVTVPPGECLVLTRKHGQEISKERLAAGDVLAREGERGIVAEVKLPGSHRLNPFAYSWEKVPAVEIRFGQVGVRTLKVGKDPRGLPAGERRGRYVVPAGYRGVQEEPVPPGTYYLNHYVEAVTPIDVQVHRVELTDIQFPSRDGFLLRPHIIVTYAVQPDKAPELMVRLSDEGKLHQEDTKEQQKFNEILQKIILPHMRGYARIEGSNLDAKDFIGTGTLAGDEKVNNRERFQRALRDKVRPQCKELGIDIQAVTLAALDLPPELIEQISARDVARVQLENNKSREQQYKSEQKLKAVQATAQQETEKVTAETRLSQAKKLAEQKKEVEKKRLENELANAQVKLEAARNQAKAVLATGKTEADIINLQNEAEVAGLRKAVKGFNGPQHFAQYQVLLKLAPALKEIFASDDSDFAKLFASYMTPPPAGNGKAPAVGPPDAPMKPGGP
jgi:hypothetical protein